VKLIACEQAMLSRIGKRLQIESKKIVLIIIIISLRTMDIRHFFAKKKGPDVLEQGPSISNKIDSNS
jgi:hypothetical protein